MADITLTAEQRSFVEHYARAAILHAPVGTGKTLCLAERAALAIRRGTPAPRILCVTFTNLAAEQMRARILARCGRAGSGVVVRTFHSLCAWILRAEAKAVGVPADFVIFDEDDSLEMLRALLHERPGQPESSDHGHTLRDLLERTARAKIAAATAGPGPGSAALPAHVPQTAHTPYTLLDPFASLGPRLRTLAASYQSAL